MDSSSTVPAGYTLTGGNISFNSSNGLYNDHLCRWRVIGERHLHAGGQYVGEAEAAHSLQLDVRNGTGYVAAAGNGTAMLTIAANGLVVTTTADSGDGYPPGDHRCGRFAWRRHH